MTRRPNAEAPYPAFDGTQPCAAEDPELFFPFDSASTVLEAPAAINACRRCPFIRECLAYALTHDVSGIWGGTFSAQRHAIRKEHGINPISLVQRDYVSQDEVVQMERGGVSAPEISHQLGISLDAVHAHLARSRRSTTS